jgi:hypothetical protein
MSKCFFKIRRIVMKLITRTLLIGTSVLGALSLSVGCSPKTKTVLVYGESTICLSHAAAQVNVAMKSSAAFGYRPISVGGGVGVGIGDDSKGKLYTVLMVLEGPASAPDLAPGSGAPLNADIDGDGIPDGVEYAHGLDPKNPADAAGDLDNDGLTNIQEYNTGTNMFEPDTDGDSYKDGLDAQPMNDMVH